MASKTKTVKKRKPKAKPDPAIGMQLSQSEKAEIEQAASLLGLSMSSYVSFLFSMARRFWIQFEGEPSFQKQLQMVEQMTRDIRGKRRKSKQATHYVVIRLSKYDRESIDRNREPLELSRKEYVLLLHFMLETLGNLLLESRTLPLINASIKQGVQRLVDNLEPKEDK